MALRFHLACIVGSVLYLLVFLPMPGGRVKPEPSNRKAEALTNQNLSR